jgi:hypothetical protein
VGSVLAELTAPDGTSLDGYGFSVAMTGTTLVVGAPYKNGDDGAVYVYVRTGTTWTYKAELTAPDPTGDDFFGRSVAIAGSTIAVGAPFSAAGGSPQQGAVYVFHGSGPTWTLQQELFEPFPSESAFFGESVSLSGARLAVGADYSAGSEIFTETGVAYVFLRRGAAWHEEQELRAPDAAYGDEFGWSISINGSSVVVGAPNRDVGGNADEGTVYVYVRTGTMWNLQQEITPADGAAGDDFGWSVGVLQNTFVSGALAKTVGGDVDRGAAYVFTRSGGVWALGFEVTPVDTAAHSAFGAAVAIAARRIVMSAANTDVGTSAHQGIVYDYALVGGAWTPHAELTPSDAVANDEFGYSVALAGTTLAAGAIGHGANGTAYVLHS